MRAFVDVLRFELRHIEILPDQPAFSAPKLVKLGGRRGNAAFNFNHTGRSRDVGHTRAIHEISSHPTALD